MDAALDMDNHVADLQIGLPTGLDENTVGLNSQRLIRQGSRSADFSNSNRLVADDQISMLYDMVVGMKQEIQASLTKLVEVHDEEDVKANCTKKLQSQQQQQLDYLTETVNDIKIQLSSLARNIEEVKNEQKVLKNGLGEVRPDNSQMGKTCSDRARSRPDLLDDFSGGWKTKISEVRTGADSDCSDVTNLSDRIVNSVTEVACKSLSLTQTLSEECLRFRQPQMSDGGENGEQERLLMSYQASKRAQSASGDLSINRSHRTPITTRLQDRGQNVFSAVQRQKSVADLADSERDYCCKLWSLIHNYFLPLETAGILNPRELDTMFPPYLDRLYEEHHFICSGLQDRLIHWTYTGTVADLLARVTDFHNSESLLSLYKDYTDGLPAAVACLRKAMICSEDFQSFLKAVQQGNCQSEDLMSLLLAPAQEIPKYLLQLQEVIYHTPPTHFDFQVLQMLIDWLGCFVDQLNKDTSNNLKVQDQLMGHAPSVWSASPSHKINQWQGEQIQPGYLNIASQMTRSGQSPFNNSRTTQDMFFYSLPRQIRPSSAVDFSSHLHSNNNSLGNQPAQYRDHKPSDPRPRPHTVLGQQQTPNVSRKPIVISRKPLRRKMQQQNAAAVTAHYETTASTATPSNAEHPHAQKVVSDLPPLPPVLHHQASNHDDYAEENDEDDTRADNTQPNCATRSFPCSNESISDDVPETNQDSLYCHSNKNQNKAQDSGNTSEFSSGNVTPSASVNLSKTHEVRTKDYSESTTKQTHDGLSKQNAVQGLEDSELKLSHMSTTRIPSGIKNVSNLPESKQTHELSKKNAVQSLNDYELKSTPMNNTRIPTGNKNVPNLPANTTKQTHNESSKQGLKDSELKLSHMSTTAIPIGNKNDPNLSKSSVDIKNSLHTSAESKDIKDNVFCPRDGISRTDYFPASCNLLSHNTLQEQGADLLSKSNIMTNSNPGEVTDNVAYKNTQSDGIKSISMRNRQNIQALTNRVPSRERKDAENNMPNNKISKDRSMEYLSKDSDKSSGCYGNGDTSQEIRSNPCKVLPHPSARINTVDSYQLSQTPVIKVTLGEASIKSGLSSNGHSKYLHSSETNKDDTSYPPLASSQKLESHLAQKALQNRLSNPASQSSYFHDSSNPSALTYRGNHSIVHGKLQPQFSLSTNSTATAASHREAETNISNIKERLGLDVNDCHLIIDTELSKLPTSQVLCARNKGKQPEHKRSRMRSEANYNSMDSLPMSNDDHAVTKKKTPFKASIKHLFTRKRGSVILADVEREVLLEIRAAATKSTNYVNSFSKFIDSLRSFHIVRI